MSNSPQSPGGPEGPASEAPSLLESLAPLLELSLIAPDLSEQSVAEACDFAKQHSLAAVLVRPSDLDLAARMLGSGAVRIATLAGGPHGYSTTAVKTYETRELLRRGAHEIDTVMNTGKLISRQFQYLEMELLQMADSCHQSGAILKINLESEFLNEELNIVACRIARRAGADFIGTSKLADVPLLQAHSKDKLKIKYHAPQRDLETAAAFRDAGCSRVSHALS